jgi:hypothetical protein
MYNPDQLSRIAGGKGSTHPNLRAPFSALDVLTPRALYKTVER